ncbi:MMPL family transporter [Reichenbachiella carrageenanivorans]|uniref:MMPL family transporter n=1 Tax=Reichenbachiella carrageenanivorans TaxID=2979869 RepID=A0ABY6CZC4_9BACT|nr:MMPL family transporter [Reichenbachiella carrageenanivorans]UXX79271.1 MMPL family transporter [Reichenbachiella carrageenanivorans]
MINKRNSFLALALAVILLGLLANQLPNLRFDYELENFFPTQDPDLIYYQEFTETFGHDNDYLLIGFEAQPSLFDIDFLGHIDEGLKAVGNLAASQRVISPTSLRFGIKTPMGQIPIPLLHLEDRSKLLNDSVKLYKHPLFREMFIAKSGKSMKAIVLHKRFASKEKADEYVDEIRGVFEKQNLPVRIAGKAVAQTAFVNAVKDDFSKFIIIALVLIFLMLLFFMRNLLLITMSLLIAGLSVVATIGFMALTGKDIDVLSSLIPTILLVVSMSDIIHLYAHIQQEYNESKNLKASINQAVRKVGIATLLTSFTTAIGFLTLVTIQVKPIIDLGLYAAAGIAFAFIITYLLFPTLACLTQPTISQPSSGFMQNCLKSIYKMVSTRGKSIGLAAMLVLVVSLIGLKQVEVDAYLVNDLPKHDPVKTDFIFFDEEFSGSKPFTLSLWIKDDTKPIYSQEVITQMEKIEHLIRKHTGAGDLISPVSFVKFANQSLHQAAPESYQLPESSRDWQKVFQQIRKTHPERKSTKVSTEALAQITGYFQDLGSKDATIKYEKLIHALDEQVDHQILGYRLTGTTLLIDKSHELLSMNLIKGLLLAMLIVGLIAGVMFRSWRMVLITLLPNLFPILVVAAIMGYFSIPLNLSTSVIFAISFGIVVDDTLHFLSQFKQEYQPGIQIEQAIERSILATGRPILITTILLTSGFIVFCFSNFSATFFMGLFVSISFVTALLTDLYLLPVLLIWFLPKKTKDL